MEQDDLFELLRQQGFRHINTNDASQCSLFEWRVETIVIPHPSGDVYSPIEIGMIDRLVAIQTFYEASLITAIQTMRT